MRKRLLDRHLVVALAFVSWSAQADKQYGSFDQLMLQFQNPTTASFNPQAYAEILEKSVQRAAIDAQQQIESRGANSFFAKRLLSLPADTIVSMNMDPTPQEIASDNFFKMFGITNPDRLASIKEMILAMHVANGKKLSPGELEKFAELVANGKSGDDQIDAAMLADLQANADQYASASDADKLKLMASFNDALGNLAGKVDGSAGELLSSAHTSFSEALRDPNIEIKIPSVEENQSFEVASNPLKNGKLFEDFEPQGQNYASYQNEGAASDAVAPKLDTTKSAELKKLVDRQDTDTTPQRTYVAGVRPSFSAEGGSKAAPDTGKTTDNIFNRHGKTTSGEAEAEVAPQASGHGQSESAIKERLGAITNEVNAGRAGHGSGTTSTASAKPDVGADTSPKNDAGTSQASKPQADTKPNATAQTKTDSDAKMKEWLIDSSARMEASNKGLSGKDFDAYYEKRVDEMQKKDEISGKPNPDAANPKVAENDLDYLKDYNSHMTASALGLTGEAFLTKKREIRANIDDPSLKAKMPASQCLEARRTVFAALAQKHVNDHGMTQKPVYKDPNLGGIELDDKLSETFVGSQSDLRGYFLGLGEHIEKAFPAYWCPQFKDETGKNPQLANFGEKEHKLFVDVFEAAQITHYRAEMGPTAFRNHKLCPNTDESIVLEKHRVFVTALAATQMRARKLILPEQQDVNWCKNVSMKPSEVFESTPLGTWLKSCPLDAARIAAQIAVQPEADSEDCLQNKSALALFRSVGIGTDLPSDIHRIATKGQHQ